MRRDHLQRRSRHADPDIHQHEIHRPTDVFQGFAQIAFTQVDEAAQAGLLEMRPCRTCLVRLVFGADHLAGTARRVDGVAQRRGEIERRHPPRGAGLDNPARLAGTAKLVAEFRLVAVERDQLVAPKRFYLRVRGRLRTCCPLGVVASDRRHLRVAARVQAGQQGSQFRIVNRTKGRSLRWHDPGRFSGYDLSPRVADTPASQSVSGWLAVVKRAAPRRL